MAKKYRWKSQQVRTVVVTDMVTMHQSQQFHIAVGRLVDPPAPRVRKVKAVEKLAKVRPPIKAKPVPPTKGFHYLVRRGSGECTRLPDVPTFADVLKNLLESGYEMVEVDEYMEVKRG